jgi:hypothetical protein
LQLAAARAAALEAAQAAERLEMAALEMSQSQLLRKGLLVEVGLIQRLTLLAVVAQPA